MQSYKIVDDYGEFAIGFSPGKLLQPFVFINYKREFTFFGSWNEIVNRIEKLYGVKL